jgi:S-methylmethionine-dependent homocysteine/selenocysteine methylase
LKKPLIETCAIAGAATETAIAEAIKLFFIENLLKVEQTAKALRADTLVFSAVPQFSDAPAFASSSKSVSDPMARSFSVRCCSYATFRILISKRDISKNGV